MSTPFDDALDKGYPRRAVLSALALSALGIKGVQAATTDPTRFPARPVRLIVSFSPGGLVDTFGRYIGDKLSPTWNQPVIIDNKPGANQIIGTEQAAKSPADGYTLYIGTQSGLVFNPAMMKNIRYDAVRDFAPITGLFTSPLYLVVNASKVQARSVAELVSFAKANPGKLTYASIGRGSSHHLAAEMFKAMTGTDILHVAYKGSGAAMTDLLGGQVDLMFEGGTSALPNVKTGKLRALASSSMKRTEAMPELPTVAETVPGFEINAWMALFAPSGTPPAVIEQINKDVVAILNMPETHRQFADVGVEVMPTTPQGITDLIAAQVPRWTQIIKQAGIDPE